MDLKEKQKQMLLGAKAFINGMSSGDVQKKYGICYASIYNAIKKYNLPYNKTYGRSIFFNEHFFHNIDTEEKAYWLGFIFADGSIIKTSKNMDKYNRLSICLSKKDEHHLEKFTDAIEYPKDNIKHANCSNIGEYPQSYVRINSIALVDDLISLNCNPNKTFTPSFPSNKDIPSNLIRDFVRGYFDGDGCISGKVKSPLFEITSELYAIQQLQGILMDSCNLSKTKLRFCRNSYTLRYGGINQIKKIFHYLYDGATVFLERKYKKFTTYVFTKDQTISF